LKRRSVVDGVADVTASPAVDEQPNDIEVAGKGGLMKRGGMRVGAGR